MLAQMSSNLDIESDIREQDGSKNCFRGACNPSYIMMIGLKLLVQENEVGRYLSFSYM